MFKKFEIQTNEIHSNTGGYFHEKHIRNWQELKQNPTNEMRRGKHKISRKLVAKQKKAVKIISFCLTFLH